MTTKQKHTQLKNLAKDAKANLYEMIKLADQIVSDHEYIDEMGGEDVVLEMLEADEFSHFGGSPSLSQMLHAFRANPDLKTWKEYRFDIWRMIDLATPSKDPVERVRTNWKARAEELEVEKAGLEEKVSSMSSELEELKQQNAELSRENSELRGELRGLTRKFATV